MIVFMAFSFLLNFPPITEAHCLSPWRDSSIFTHIKTEESSLGLKVFFKELKTKNPAC